MQHEVTTGRLYVGNLSYDVTETDLTELFGGIGQVRHAEVVVNRATQRSKGFAFVEMLTVDEAKRAVAELHDKEYMGRKMLVTGAKADDQPKPAESEERPVRLQEEPTLREDRPYRREDRPAPREDRPREERPREDRPREERPRRESRPASPVMGDITTGIIRREQIEAAASKPPTP
jgi:RNA recognition motif-containing protein